MGVEDLHDTLTKGRKIRGGRGGLGRDLTNKNGASIAIFKPNDDTLPDTALYRTFVRGTTLEQTLYGQDAPEKMPVRAPKTEDSSVVLKEAASGSESIDTTSTADSESAARSLSLPVTRELCDFSAWVCANLKVKKLSKVKDAIVTNGTLSLKSATVIHLDKGLQGKVKKVSVQKLNGALGSEWLLGTIPDCPGNFAFQVSSMKLRAESPCSICTMTTTLNDGVVPVPFDGSTNKKRKRSQ